MRPRTACFFSTAGLALLISIGTARASTDPAAAASRAPDASTVARSPEFHKKAFQVSKTLFSRDPTIDACVNISVHGTLQYRTKLIPGKVHITSMFDREILEPTVTIKAFRGPKCQTAKSPVRLNSATLQQRWYEYRCSVNPGISVSGLPFSVGVQPTLHCGEVRVAHRSTTSSTPQSTYRQSSSGAQIRFGDVAIVFGSKPACIGFDVTAKVVVRGASDTLIQGFKVCP